MAPPDTAAARAAAPARAPSPGLGTHLLHRLYDGLFVAFLVLSLPYFVIRSSRDAGLRSSLGGRFGRGPSRSGARSCVWVHGVSVGEVKTAASLVRGLEAQHPGVEVAISSTTTAGMSLARTLYPDHFLFQFPLDLSFVVRKVLRRVRPSMIVLMELEVWPNLLLEAQLRGVPVVVVNGRISRRSFRGYRLFRRILPRFDSIDTFSVQNREYAERLLRLGVPARKVHVTGNLKFDNLQQSLDGARVEAIRRELGLAPGEQVWVAGSTHPGEEELLLEVHAQLRGEFPGLRLVLAPRHVERSPEVMRCIERLHGKCAVLTEIRARRSVPPRDAVLLVDTIGELDLLYGVADVVFVGGSMVSRGGHNILEPASLGKPVLFGPHMDNFLEEVRVLEGAGVHPVQGPAALAAELRRLLQEPEAARDLGRRAKEAVATVRGTTDRNLQLILSRLSP